MKNVILISSLITLWLCAGCAGPAGNVVVPSSDLMLSIMGEPQHIILPKDESFSKFKLTARKGTNSVTLLINDMKSANSEAVIAQAFLGQAKLLQINAEMLKDALGALTEAVKTSAAAARANAAQMEAMQRKIELSAPMGIAPTTIPKP